MRNFVKKVKMNIACILTSLMLLVSPIQTPMVVQAAEPQFGSSTLTYTVDDYSMYRFQRLSMSELNLKSMLWKLISRQRSQSM